MRPRTPSLRRRAIAAALPLVALVPPAHAQTAPSGPQQVVRGPVATYWISADTASGLGAMAGGGLGAMLGMMGGGAPQALRTLDLRLGSSRSPAGAPEAAHLIPASMGMGPQLPLLTPEAARATPAPDAEPALPGRMEQPKGRLLVFWGCGERAGPGQPVVIDFSKVAAGQPMPALVSRAPRLPRGPSPDASRTYGAWPNERDRSAVPAQASLLGEHRVRGSYSPEIRFAVERHDFMPPVALEGATTPAGARRLTWRPVAGATGYFASAVGASESGGGTDLVMWTSSAVQETGGALGDFLPPGEVARLIRERVAMPPDRTECTMPEEAARAMPQGMLTFTAYGDELNLAHPPRPADPKVPWDIEWAVKLRTRSSAMQPLGMLDATAGAGRGPAPAAASPAAASPPGAEPRGDDAGTAPSAGATPAPASPSGLPVEAVEQGVREGVRMLRGLIGR